MTPVFYCWHCAEILGELMPIFVQICDCYFLLGNPIEIELDRVDAKQARSFMRSISSLERAGCIISTETGLRLVSIKPIGFDQVPKDASIRTKGYPVWCLDKEHVHERV